MSMRYQAGILTASYFPLKVPDAPTIGTLSVAGSVTFTAPSDVGGGAITSYTAVATDTSSGATFITTGASSPIAISGLTIGNTYTAKVSATNAFGAGPLSAASNSATIVVQGQQAYTTAGTYSWIAPAGVTSVSVVAVGGGGSAGGGNGYGAGGGALAYKNNITVAPASSYSVVVGAGGPPTDTNGGDSSFTAGFGTMTAGGGRNRSNSATGGVPSGTYDAGYAGGLGGFTNANFNYAGSGGAAGYSGVGGQGGGNTYSPSAGSGGGGGGGGGQLGSAGKAGGGGGVGILGEGSSGAAGVSTSGTPTGGGGGSSGSAGGDGSNGYAGSSEGGAYGGGGGATGNSTSQGGVGAVRIIWPGTSRSFPSTNTGNL